MGRRRYVFDEARTQRFLKEGRGQGSLANYKPWLHIQDLPSMGRSHRPFGIKTQRVHHLLSDGEWKCFLKFEASHDVKDIQEQYPMNRLGTMKAAIDLGFKHPITLDGTPFVMTIDFLVTRQFEKSLRLEPYTFKYAPDTLTPRAHELLKIASEFWRQHGYVLNLIDETFFDEALVINYDAVRSYYDISNLSFYRDTDVAGIGRAVRRAVMDGHGTLVQACRSIGEQFQVTPQVVFSIACHLIARQAIVVDLSLPEGLERRALGTFRLAP